MNILLRAFNRLDRKEQLNWMPDKLYLQIQYRLKFGKRLDLRNPQTFNEKLQWLKLHDRKPEYTRMVDKYEAKQYIAEKIGAEYVIPTLGVWERFEDIDFDVLPDQFVLKCTHDSGGLVICRDKSNLDIEAARKKITKSLKRNYYYHGREWPYKDIKPRIIAERYLEDDGKSAGLMDYKFYCFHGEPLFLYISRGLENHATAQISFVTLDWTFAPYQRNDFMPFDKLPPRPDNLDEMISVCRKLSKDISFLRVDLYNVNNRILFSELTLSPSSGMMPFAAEEQNLNMGELIELRQ